MALRTGLKQNDVQLLVKALRKGYSWPEAREMLTGIEPRAIEAHRDFVEDLASKPLPEEITDETTPRYTKRDVEEMLAAKTGKPSDSKVMDELAKLKAELEKALKANADLKEKVEFLEDAEPAKQPTPAKTGK